MLFKQISRFDFKSLGDSLQRPDSHFLLSVFNPIDVLSGQFRMIGQKLLRPSLCASGSANPPTRQFANINSHLTMLASRRSIIVI